MSRVAPLADPVPRTLEEAIARVARAARARLGPAVESALARLTPPGPSSPPVSLERAARCYGLSGFDLDLLLVSFAAELEPALADACSAARRSEERRPNAAVVLALVGATGLDARPAALAALEPGQPLLRFGLVEVVGGGPLLDRSLALASGMAARLTEAAPRPSRYRPPDGEEAARLVLPPSVSAQLDAAAAALARGGAVLVSGPAASGRTAVARAVATRLGRGTVELDPRLPPDDLVRVRREARWWDCAPLLPASPESRALHQELELGMLLVWDEASPAELPDDVLVLRVPRPDAATRGAIFGRTLGAEAGAALGHRYALGPGRIHAITSRCSTPEDVAAAVRDTTALAFGSLASRAPGGRDWPDLIVSEEVRDEMDLALGWLLHGAQVFGTWGLGRAAGTLGLTCLLHGPPGTGKTLAAQVLAHRSGRPLYRVDLSQTVDKYIGETEKNLARIFDAARGSDAMLLFDEADAVFGKRSAVNDARDRYANVETAYLLQRLEEHEGPVVLCTNLFANLDEAFLRRLHFVVRFQAPDAEQRARLWALHLPAPEHRDGPVDIAFLAERFEITGGDIRNVTVAAGLLAAREGHRVRMEHVILGLERELRKSGRVVDPSRFGRWATRR
jgi:AAA+ superfamily predicted ATPase